MSAGQKPGSDGYYHPQNEDEIIALVKEAYKSKTPKQVRVRGSAHSCGAVIYADGEDIPAGIKVDATAPPSNNINIMLDQYSKILEVKGNLVTVQAGIHLGLAPHDITHTSTVENSLLYQLQQMDLTLSDLGGISHQTVAGFLSTGSSGGSIQYGLGSNIFAIRMIDGTGEIYEVSRDDTDKSLFHAVTVSLGLLGIISTVTFSCDKTFNIKGEQTCTKLEGAPVDIFSDDPSDSRQGIVKFLQNTDYTRMLWFPQPGGERIEVWTAHRIEAEPNFKPNPFREFFSAKPLPTVNVEMFLCNFMLTVDNINDLDEAKQKLGPIYQQYTKMLTNIYVEQGTSEPDAAAKAHKQAASDEEKEEDMLTIFSKLSLNKILPFIMDSALDAIAPLDSKTSGQPVHFQDYAWTGLPMDNAADDILIGTEFTEIWMPLNYAPNATNLLQDYFRGTEDKHAQLKRTGTYSWEMYATGPSSSWMSMAYSDGKDEWKEGAFRVDIFWFIDSTGNPRDFFYPTWRMFRQNNIPFRLHWAKFKPDMGTDENWSDFLKTQYPQWDNFLALRAKKDPKNIFLTTYWCSVLGLSAPGKEDTAVAASVDSAVQPSESDSQPQPCESYSQPQPSESDSQPQPSESDSQPQPCESNSKPQPSEQDSKPKPCESDSEPQPSEQDSKPKPSESDSKPQPSEQDSKPKPSESDSKLQPFERDSKPQLSQGEQPTASDRGMQQSQPTRRTRCIVL